VTVEIIKERGGGVKGEVDGIFISKMCKSEQRSKVKTRPTNMSPTKKRSKGLELFKKAPT
jgi:hypothetical protein